MSNSLSTVRLADISKPANDPAVQELLARTEAAIEAERYTTLVTDDTRGEWPVPIPPLDFATVGRDAAEATYATLVDEVIVGVLGIEHPEGRCELRMLLKTDDGDKVIVFEHTEYEPGKFRNFYRACGKEQSLNNGQVNMLFEADKGAHIRLAFKEAKKAASAADLMGSL